MAAEEKKCPRCGNVFACNAGNIMHCQCSSIQLSAAVKEAIGKEYEDCLCMQCLEQLSQQNAEGIL